MSNTPKIWSDPELTFANPDDPNFIHYVNKLNKGDQIKLSETEILTLEYDLSDTTGNYTEKKNFPFHQRIFEPGVILRKEGSNTRIFIEKARLDAVK